MSALEELQRKQVGGEFLALLQRTIGAVGRGGLYPSPSGGATWSADDVRTVVADFLASPQTARRLADLQTHCRNERALQLRLERTIKNFLADKGRRTPVGRLVRRFNEVLEQHIDFARDGSHWRLVDSAVEPSVADIDALNRLVSGLEVTVPTAWRTGERQSPDLDQASVVRIARAAIEAAGPLRPAELAQLAAVRLGLGAAPLSLEVTGYDPAPPRGPTDATGSAALVDIRADEVFSRLNEQERAALGLAEVSVEGLGAMLGVSGSKAHLIRRRAVSILRDELNDDEDGQDIATGVLERARIWSESWMTQHDPT